MYLIATAFFIGLIIVVVIGVIVTWNLTLESRLIENRINDSEARCVKLRNETKEFHDCILTPNTSNIDAIREDLRRHPKQADAEIYREGR